MDHSTDNVDAARLICRTVKEAKLVQDEMRKHGLERGRNGLEIYVMCEISSNVISAKAFADVFDGFSIGSNDLTQLTLGVDRDSESVAHVFDERDPAVMDSIGADFVIWQSTHRCRGDGSPNVESNLSRFAREPCSGAHHSLQHCVK